MTIIQLIMIIDFYFVVHSVGAMVTVFKQKEWRDEMTYKVLGIVFSQLRVI